MKDMHPGDMVNATAPYHRITAWIADLETQGFQFHLSETRTGYRLTCVASPHSPANKTRH